MQTQEQADQARRITRYRVEKRRGFQPPWYYVRVYDPCPDCQYAPHLKVSWYGTAPRGAIACTCGKTLFTL